MVCKDCKTTVHTDEQEQVADHFMLADDVHLCMNCAIADFNTRQNNTGKYACPQCGEDYQNGYCTEMLTPKGRKP